MVFVSRFVVFVVVSVLACWNLSWIVTKVLLCVESRMGMSRSQRLLYMIGFVAMLFVV